MPDFQYFCEKCKFEFELYKYVGNTKVVTDHGTSITSYYIDGKRISKEEYEKQSDSLYNVKCPECKSDKIKRVFHPLPVVWDDNITPGSGFAAVDKRHREGIYSPSEIRRGQEANMEMKEAGLKQAKKDYEKDRQILESTMKPITEREAVSLMKSGDRKKEITVLQAPKKE